MERIEIAQSHTVSVYLAIVYTPPKLRQSVLDNME